MFGKKSYFSLNYGYFALFALLLSALVLFTGIFTYYVYRNLVEDLERNLVLNARSVVNELEYVFEENKGILRYLGEIIKKKGLEKKPQSMAELLQATGEFDVRSLATSYVSWADKDGLITVSGRLGVIKKNFQNIIARSYFKKGRKDPWNLQFSVVTKSLFSNKKVLPTAMGITKGSDGFLGYLVLGLKIKELEDHLRQFVDTSKRSFVIVDHLGNIVFSSHGLNETATISNKIQVVLADKSQSFVWDNYSYRYIDTLTKYPFKIIFGYHKSAFFEGLISVVVPRLIEFLMVILLSALLLGLFRKMIINPIIKLSNVAQQFSEGKTSTDIPTIPFKELVGLVESLRLVKHYILHIQKGQLTLQETCEVLKSSQTAKEEFLRELNQQIMLPIKSILNYCNLLLTCFEEEKYIAAERIRPLLLLIQKEVQSFAAQNVKHFRVESINLLELLTTAIQVKSREAYEKQIKIFFLPSASYPTLYGDRLKLQQAIIGILSLSIDSLPAEAHLEISTCLMHLNGTTYVEIKFKDNGFHLGLAELKGIRARLNSKSLEAEWDATRLSLELISEIIFSHKGSIDSQVLKEGGRCTIVQLPFLPYDHASALLEDFSGGMQDNVIAFPKD